MPKKIKSEQSVSFIDSCDPPNMDSNNNNHAPTIMNSIRHSLANISNVSNTIALAPPTILEQAYMPIKNTNKKSSYPKYSDADIEKVQQTMNNSERVQLSQAVNNTVAKGELFAEALKTLMNFTPEKIAEYDIQIDAKKKEYSDLNSKLNSEFKDQQIETKHKLNEFKIKSCEDTLKDFGYVIVKKEDYAKFNSIQEELVELKHTFDAKLAIKLEKKLKKALDREKEILDLRNKVEISNIIARTTQQNKEIDNLNSIIETFKTDFAVQRDFMERLMKSNFKL